MAGKKAGALPVPKVEVDTPMTRTKESVQTVRMDLETLRALKIASAERGVRQQAIMLTAIRRELGLE